MKEFKVSEYITLKLEGEKTNIYIMGNLFQQCIFLLLNKPVENFNFLDEIDFIDEVLEILDRYNEINRRNKFEILPEVIFWGHCSNLQVWAEMDYDTRILPSNLAFPLLKKLAEIGDPIAKKVFSEEILKRLRSGNINTIFYLFEQNFNKFLNMEEIEILHLQNNPKLRKLVDKYLEPSELGGTDPKPKKRGRILKIINELVNMGDDHAKEKLRNYIISIKKRKPLPLTADAFWELIKKTRRECNNNAFIQEKLLVDELLAYSIDDVSAFKDIFSFFTSKLQDNEDLAQELVKNFNILLSDDGWYYLCLGIVGLGKDLYTMALFETPNFIRLLKTGKYGHPRNLEHEFYAISYTVMDELLGSLEFEENYFKENIDFKPIRNKIRNDLDLWYLDELKKKK